MTEYSAARQVYNSKVEKYSLPDFDELIIRFGIRKMTWPEHLILYNVLEGMNNRLQVSAYILESILTGVGCEGHCEHRMLSKEQRSEIKAMWARLQSLRWAIYMGSRSLSEKNVVEQVNQLYQFHIKEFTPFTQKYSSHFEAKWKDFNTRDSPDIAFYN